MYFLLGILATVTCQGRQAPFPSMTHERGKSFFHVSKNTSETKQGNTSPHPILQSSNLYYQSNIEKDLLKFWKVFIKMNIILINDSQLFINSDDFQLEDTKLEVNKN